MNVASDEISSTAKLASKNPAITALRFATPAASVARINRLSTLVAA